MTVTESSPRTRGCSRAEARDRAAPSVVPAHAGVFLGPPSATPYASGRPRARGGVPYARCMSRPVTGSSPRTRGRSRVQLLVPVVHAGDAPLSLAGVVVPAHAGVFPVAPGRQPRQHVVSTHAGVFPAWRTPPPSASGHTRGCSAGFVQEDDDGGVVLAHAGVFPSRRPTTPQARCPPRARGGVPIYGGRGGFSPSSSPRTGGVPLLVLIVGYELVRVEMINLEIIRLCASGQG